MKNIFLIFSLVMISFFLLACDKKEDTLYRWETSSGWEWKTNGDKNRNPQYKGQVKRKYLIFGDYIKEGLGSLNFPNGVKYMGEFKNDKYHGQGTESLPDGTIYEGQWKDGKYNGHGKYTFSNGRSFVGFWKDSAPWNISGYNAKGEFIKYEQGKKLK